MIKRLVKMQFRPEGVDEFQLIFKESRPLILGFEGCRHVELLRDTSDPTLFFTYSLWDSEAHLNAYRESDTFARVWAATKSLFAARAQAWSLSETTK